MGSRGLNVILNIAPLPTLANEVTHHQQLMAYKKAFHEFRIEGVWSTSNNSNNNTT
jgi:hypothetical protein